MEQGILLVVVMIIILAIAAVILFVVGARFAGTVLSTDFDLKCYFSFAEYTAINGFLYPLSILSGPLGFNIVSSPIAASQIQSACIQNANINAYVNTSLGDQFYTAASSCFNLFGGANQAAGNSIVKSLNGPFLCYEGSIFEQKPTSATYGQVINYIDTAYKNSEIGFQMIFITNGSDGNATYVKPSDVVKNMTRYTVYYFGKAVSYSNTTCGLNFATACNYLSKYGQPYNSPLACSYTNETPENASLPVSSLSGGIPSVNPTSTTIGACGNFYVALCGRLINTMALGQNRAFVCIENP